MSRVSALRITTLAAVGALLAGVQAAVPVSATHARAGTAYTVQDLGHLGGGSAWATDLNNKGQVVGKSLTASGAEHAFLWDPGTRRMTDLGTPEVMGDELPTFRSEATGINDLGQVVGLACHQESFYSCLGFVWSPVTGRATYLGRYPSAPFENVRPTAINDLGQIVGSVDYYGAAWWSPEAGWRGVRDPSRLGGIGTAVDINNAGQIVGGGSATIIGPDNGELEPYIFDLRTERATFLPEGCCSEYGFAVNEAGVVVANSYGPIVWDTVSGEVLELPRGGVGADINESGQVVGDMPDPSNPSGQTRRGFVWDRAGGIQVPLRPLGDDLSSYASAINDQGQVAGTSVSASGRGRAVVWPPTTILKPVAVTASADTYVNELAAKTNFGTTKSLATRGHVGTRYESYLRFALPKAPAGSTLVQVTLRIRSTGEEFAGSAAAQSVRLVAGSWSETGTTFKNRPALGARLGGIDSASKRGSLYTVVLDTTAVRARLGGTIDLALTGAEVDDALWLSSRETGDPVNRPRLTLTFAR